MVNNYSRGKLIVIDGADGSGKTDQTRMLMAKLDELRYDCETISFPRYGNPAAEDVAKYLRGDFGDKENIEPKRVATFYAKDRADFAPTLESWLKAGKIVVSNRYTSSNVGHQSIRYETIEEQDRFIDWLLDYEYNMLGIPRPDATIFLHVPCDVAMHNILLKEGGRDDRKYLNGKKADIHECDSNHLSKAIEAYKRACDSQKNWYRVDCTESGHMLSYPQIQQLIWDIVEPIVSQGIRER